ncbi:MAG: hypothetical protein GY756_04490 [bacterium]|nr:hypothetical protein [bacterium]
MINKFIALTLFLLCTNLYLTPITYANKNRNSDNNKLNYHAVKTEHSITINDSKLSYNVIPGRLPIYKQINSKRVHLTDMSYIAYFLKNDDLSVKRPVTFLFNGDPGACSSDINFLGTGPKICKIRVPKEYTLEKKQELVSNPDTWL